MSIISTNKQIINYSKEKKEQYGEIFTPYSIFPLLCALSWAASNIILKFIPEATSVVEINLYTLIFSAIGSLILFLLSAGYAPVRSYEHFVLLILLGVLGGLASILFIYAYRSTSPSILAPFEYLGIPSAILLGWIFFSEKPFGQLFPGAILIVVAGLIIIWREKSKKKLI